MTPIASCACLREDIALNAWSNGRIDELTGIWFIASLWLSISFGRGDDEIAGLAETQVGARQFVQHVGVNRIGAHQSHPLVEPLPFVPQLIELRPEILSLRQNR